MFARISGAILLVLGLISATALFWAYAPGDPEAVFQPIWLHYVSLAASAVWFLLMIGVLALLIFRRGWPLLYWLSVLAFLMSSITRLLTYRASGEPFVIAESQLVLSLSVITVALWTVAGCATMFKSPEFFIPRKLR